MCPKAREVPVKRSNMIGLVIAMAMALTAVVGAASASAAQFRAEEYISGVTGTQTATQKFKLKNTEISCTTATSSGAIFGPSTTLTVTPSFSGCAASLPVKAAITANTNGCDYVYKNSGEPYENNGTMDISCSKGIEFTGGGCTFKIPPQTGRGNVKFKNSGGYSRNHTISVDYEVTGLTYSISGTFCIEGVGTYENGTYTGTSVLKGYNASHAVGLYLSLIHI